MKLLLKYPTRSRPQLFRETFARYRDMLSGRHDYRFLITMDADDATMNDPTMIEFLEAQDHLTYTYGLHRSKVEAINADMDKAEDYDVLLLVSDDMQVQVKGYDDIIASKMQESFPDTFGALHFADGLRADRLITLSIMGRKLYESFGYLYHPQYVSLWCDNEFTDVVYERGLVAHSPQTIIAHKWTGNDPLYRRNEKFMQADAFTYKLRKAAGFPRESVAMTTAQQALYHRLLYPNADEIVG